MTAHATDQEPTLVDRVESWLEAEMSIISNHGGTSAVRKADPEDGEVIIELGGTCSGCGISPITAENIERELSNAVDAIEDVTVRFADAGGSQWDVQQRESVMGIDRTEGGRGDWGDESDKQNHF